MYIFLDSESGRSAPALGSGPAAAPASTLAISLVSDRPDLRFHENGKGEELENLDLAPRLMFEAYCTARKCPSGTLVLYDIIVCIVSTMIS
jgi:hypothetical protein